MSGKCYVGQPIEFRAKYEGILVKVDGGPGTIPVQGLKMTGVTWLKPDKIHIGRGFSVEPELPHGITHYGPEASYDLQLNVSGPGIPSVQPVTFQWGLSPCLPKAGTTNMKCKQFMNMEVLHTSSGPSTFVVQFVSGYSEQQFTQGWNEALWRVCYDGPFESVRLAPLPDIWQLERIPLWIDLLLARIDECGDSASCDVNVQPSIDALDGAIAQLLELPTRKSEHRLRYDLVASLDGDKTELREIEALLRRSGETQSADERREIRGQAVARLRTARESSSRAMALLSQLQRALVREPR